MTKRSRICRRAKGREGKLRGQGGADNEERQYKYVTRYTDNAHRSAISLQTRGRLLGAGRLGPTGWASLSRGWPSPLATGFSPGGKAPRQTEQQAASRKASLTV